MEKIKVYFIMLLVVVGFIVLGGFLDNKHQKTVKEQIAQAEAQKPKEETYDDFLQKWQLQNETDVLAMSGDIKFNVRELCPTFFKAPTSSIQYRVLYESFYKVQGQNDELFMVFRVPDKTVDALKRVNDDPRLFGNLIYPQDFLIFSKRGILVGDCQDDNAIIHPNAARYPEGPIISIRGDVLSRCVLRSPAQNEFVTEQFKRLGFPYTLFMNSSPARVECFNKINM